MGGFEEVLLAGAVLTVASILASRVSGKLGVPALLLFLGVGMLAGSEGIGGIYFDDAQVAQSIAIVALIYILFAGGLQTRWSDVKPVAGTAVVLATFGVVLTALALGGFAWLVLGLDPLIGLLLGSIVASTDAAAVFAVFAGHGVRLKGRMRPLLELESGSNDPMAVFLTTGVLSLITQPGSSILGLVPAFVAQMTLGVLAGYALGLGAAWLTNRIRLDAEGLYPVLTLAFAILAYVLTGAIGGNGFLGVYVAGLVMGSRDLIHKQTLIQFHDGVAWLMQITMFLALGLLVFPSDLVPVVGDGLLASLFLMFVARPFAVLVTLAFSSYTWREKLLVSWVGLRGAVPIVLATFPLLAGIPEAELLFDLIFFIVLTSALLQGTTLVPVARLLGLQAPEPDGRPVDASALGPIAGRLRELTVEEGSSVAGRAIVDVGVPRRALILLVFRGADFVIPRGATILEPGDRLLILAEQEAIDELAARLHSAPTPPSIPAVARDVNADA